MSVAFVTSPTLLFVICIIEKRTGDADVVTHSFKLGCMTLCNERCGEIPPSSSCEIDKPRGKCFLALHTQTRSSV